MNQINRRLPLAICSLLFLLLLSWLTASLSARATAFVPPSLPDRDPATTPTRIGPDYGLNFINSIEHPADATQYQNGLSTGATWNRWPLYWNRLEPSPGQFVWEQHDAIVQADLDHGLNINAILLGTPSFYTTSARSAAALAAEPPIPPDTLAVRAIQAAAPQGLYDPVFTDGTDTPGPGKQINPNNRWARFVHEIVNRYKPGGTLAQARNWPAGQGITHWEMWNEPDYHIFWDSSLADYARLLKVGYLAAKQADNTAVVLFGGLANNGNLNFYEDVLAIYDNDPLAPAHGYFHDIFVTHSYSYAWQSWYHVYRSRGPMNRRNLDKPIWLNESGVPAWNDYPGPVWDSQSGLRATVQEQANFILQSAMYARFAGADAIFHFQLYDGCGNQPAYTNFPPHNGELCDSNGKLISDPSKPCAGDANGLFSNPSDAICFAQHPTPESPRPSFTAYKLLTTYLQDIEPLWRLRPGGEDPNNGPQELIAFYQPHQGKRVIGMWARDNRPQTAVIPATAGQALLLHADGSQRIIYPENGAYRIALPGATNRNAFWDPNLYMIGGETRILIEDYEPLPLLPQAYLPIVAR